MFDATVLALLGVSIAVGLGAVGSSIGTTAVARVGAMLLAKEPNKFPQVLVLTALPSSQALYGFLFGIIIMLQTGLLGGQINVDSAKAFGYMIAALPVGLACLFSGIAQGRVAASGIKIVSEKPDNLNQAIVLAALLESFAIFGLIVSIIIAFVGLA